jgi:hypothetical protein
MGLSVPATAHTIPASNVIASLYWRSPKDARGARRFGVIPRRSGRPFVSAYTISRQLRGVPDYM